MTNFDSQQPNREWWAQRWIDVLESFGWRRRLERARNYARQGNVLSLEFQGHKVIAQVQGTAPEPYDVTLSLEPFSDEQWGYVVESLSQRAIFSAKLLAGEMPQNIEEVFTTNGLSLFPFNKFDIHSRCSCPDPANPCKHIGAVYYLLGDRFSEDPFVLFQLRGRSKDLILSTLRELRSASPQDADASPSQSPIPNPQSPLNLQHFWQYDTQLEPSLVVITPPPSSETVLDFLGNIPLKSDASSSASQSAGGAIADYLKNTYAQISQQAVLTAMNTGSQES